MRAEIVQSAGAGTGRLFMNLWREFFFVPVEVKFGFNNVTEATFINDFFYRAIVAIVAAVLINRKHFVLLSGKRNKFFALFCSDYKWFFYHHMFAGKQSLFCIGIMRIVGRVYNHQFYFIVGQQLFQRAVGFYLRKALLRKAFASLPNGIKLEARNRCQKGA